MSALMKFVLIASAIGFAASAQAAPDLVIDSFSTTELTPPAANETGCRAHYTVKVSNHGPDPAGAPFKVLVRSEPAPGKSGFDLDYQMVEQALQSGQEHIFDGGEIVLYGGQRTVSFTADADQQVAESDEANNRKTQTANVPLNCGPEPTEHWVTCPNTNPPVNAPTSQECPKGTAPPVSTGPATCWDKSTAASIDQCPTATCLQDGKTVHDPKKECPQVTCPNGHGAGKYTYSIDAECPAIIRCDGDSEGKRVADYNECKQWVRCGGPSNDFDANFQHSWAECPDYSCPNSGAKVKDGRTCPKIRCPNGGEWKMNFSDCPSAAPKPTPPLAPRSPPRTPEAPPSRRER